jgi:putative SOS response-associated peptidase YedK
MCGRYTLGERPEISEHLQLRFPLGPPWTEPHYNIAPGQAILTVVADADGRRAEGMRWGFQPGWYKAKPGQPPPINARAETLLERPMFRGAVGKTRCLIPADGFYEWQAVPGSTRKQPLYIRLRDGELFCFAGLYTVRQDAATGEPQASCAIVTTAPNALMASIHNRMPVILREADEALWLAPEVTDPVAVLPCLEPYPAEQMEA